MLFLPVEEKIRYPYTKCCLFHSKQTIGGLKTFHRLSHLKEPFTQDFHGLISVDQTIRSSLKKETPPSHLQKETIHNHKKSIVKSNYVILDILQSKNQPLLVKKKNFFFFVNLIIFATYRILPTQGIAKIQQELAKVPVTLENCSSDNSKLRGSIGGPSGEPNQTKLVWFKLKKKNQFGLIKIFVDKSQKEQTHLKC